MKTKVMMALGGICLAGCGASVTRYTKPQAAWGMIERVAVLPFSLPSENPVRREQVTQLFAAQLRQVHRGEVVEVSTLTPLGIVPSIEEVAKSTRADAVFTGWVDETQGTTVQVNLYDAATGELLWSGSYLLSAGAEFFTLQTQQQKFQKAFRRLVRDFSRARGLATPSRRI